MSTEQENIINEMVFELNTSNDVIHALEILLDRKSKRIKELEIMNTVIRDSNKRLTNKE